MIKNKDGYDGTKKLLEKWKREYAEFIKTEPDKEQAWAWDAHKGSMELEIKDLENELKDFEDLTAGKVELPSLKHIYEIPNLLIKWRLAKQWSQEELAEEVGLLFIELLAHEKTDYKGCRFEMMCKIKETLEGKEPKNPINELEKKLEDLD